MKEFSQPADGDKQAPGDRPNSAGPSARLLWGGLFLLNGLFFGLLVLRPVPHHTLVALDNLMSAAIPMVGALGCLTALARSGRRAASGGTRGEGRKEAARAARAFGLAALGYSAGSGVWAYYELLRHHPVPFPSWADAVYLSTYVFMALGILWLPLRPVPSALRGRVLLDGLMTMTAVVTFSWYFLLGPTLLEGSETTLGKILGAAYPLGDLVLLLCLLAISMHAREPHLRPVIRALSIGLGCAITADVVFGYGTLHGTYATGCPVDAGWSLGYTLIALAGFRLASGMAGDGAARPAREGPSLPDTVLWRSLLPYALVPAVAALRLFTLHIRGDEKLEPGVCIGSLLLFGLVLLRQVLAILENRQLNRSLQAAYEELSAQNDQLQETQAELEAQNDELQQVRTILEFKNRSLAVANARLENLATTDGLTGLKNHRAFQEQLERECERSLRYDSPLSLLLMDVDDFKSYNDAFGHPAGDEVLKTVAQILEENARDTDFVARYGGEEFVVILPHTDTISAKTVGERFRAALEAAPTLHRSITASFGAASLTPGTPTGAKLVQEADQALYHAKASGCNRVHHAADTPGGVPLAGMPGAHGRAHSDPRRASADVGNGSRR